jgi:4'-phosphopantetheinyl transferase
MQLGGRPIAPTTPAPDRPVRFSACVAASLLASGFSAPAPGETCVALFDSRQWHSYAIEAETLLDARERARAARFRFEKDYLTYVLIHALWRMALGHCLGIHGARVVLTTSAAGQPCLPGVNLSTSLSHSGHYAAVAISTAVTVGIDIEQSPSRVALEELMPTMCSAEEIGEVGALPPGLRETALLRLWTRKEAVLKAFGVGLGADMALVSVWGDEPVASPVVEGWQAPCTVRDLRLYDGLAGAIATPAGYTWFRQAICRNECTIPAIRSMQNPP